jgi:hypothetical protein
MQMKPALFVSLLVAAGCVSGATTDGTVTPVGPFSTVTTDLRDSATYPAGTSVTVHAHVTHTGLPLIGVAVGWSVLAGHGKLSAASTNTDSLGVASVVWVLNDTAGVNTLAVASGDAADTLHLVGIIGAPSALVAVSADSSAIAAGGSVSLQVRVVDRPGNPLANVGVNWSTTGGSVSPASTVSDASGIASAVFSASQPGAYLVTADLPQRASVVFKVTVR